MSKFYDKIKNANIERQIEDVYNEGISFYFKEEDGSPLKFTYPYACDGLIQTKLNSGKILKLLMEYKFDLDFSNKVARAKVIIQAIFYIKRFELDGLPLPNVILIGDKDECFVFHSNNIIKYLDKNVDWKIAASSAAEKNPDLVLEIANDDNINPFIFVINENFHFKAVAEKIISLTNDIQRYVHVTEHNISNIFDYFTNRVVKNVNKISANDIVAIFMGIITNNDNYYIHPNKTNTLITPFGDIMVDPYQFKSFIGYFNRTYTPQEKMKFSEISDRLIEDTNRRNKGEFYTPTLFVDYAHKMISEALGENWKDEYVVWDNCCGTKNLTRDYRFKELYCSTLENAELDISSKYNPEATSFQFDFLNDPLDKLPKGLLNAFENNKPIVFFLNPPYATTNGLAISAKTKTDVVTTKINKLMKDNKIGRCSENLYAQFLYRLFLIKEQYNLTNCHICIYSPITFLTQQTFKVLRHKILDNFGFNSGCYFNASNFGNVSPTWGISFSILSSDIINQNKNEFMYNIIENKEGEISLICNKLFYNQDNIEDVQTYYSNTIKNNKKIESCSLSSGLIVSDKIFKFSENGIGYVSINNQGVAFTLSKVFSHTHGIDITKNNFIEIVQYISSRNLKENNWINCKDAFFVGKQNNEFINDSIIYSIFHNYCQMTSLKNIKNEFFWMSKEEIEELANKYNNDTCYMDAHTDKNRFVYEKLQTIELSSEAKVVLEKANEIVRKTFKYRELFNLEHPEYQINNWDCGWYQIKVLAKEYANDDLEEFKVLYKNLADKMRPMVYELGFLKE